MNEREIDMWQRQQKIKKKVEKWKERDHARCTTDQYAAEDNKKKVEKTEGEGSCQMHYGLLRSRR